MRKVNLSLKIGVLLSVVMVAALCVSGCWSAFSQQEQAQKEMLEKAQILAQEMDAVWTFFETTLYAVPLCSMKSQCAAPRERASMPSWPVPANRSRTSASRTWS